VSMALTVSPPLKDLLLTCRAENMHETAAKLIISKFRTGV